MTSMLQARNDLNPIAASSRVVVCGVDTDKELHVAAVIATAAAYWAATDGSYGAGVTRRNVM